MKIKSLFTFLLVIILVSSCIPSLHPIYTDSTRAVDDRLLGTWTTKRSISMEDISYDLTVTSEGDTTILVRNAEEGVSDDNDKMPESLKLAFEELGISEKASWTFEQAAKITFTKDPTADSNSNVKITLNPGVPSFVPEGYVIKNEEKLPYYILTHKEEDEDEITTNYLIVNMTKISGEMYLDFVPYPKGDKLRRGTFGANYIAGHTFAKVGFNDNKLNLEMFDGDFVEKLIKSKKVRLRHEKLGIDGDIVLTASTKELRSFIGKYGDNPDLFDDAEVLVQL